MFNVLGDPIDGLEELKDAKRLSIHRNPPKFKDQSSGTTKIKTLEPQAGDRVWIGGNAATEALNRILETRGLQARVEFLLITE